MITYTTRNSVFEVDPDTSRVRRVEGVNPPTKRLDPDGEWKTYAQAEEVAHPAGGSVLFIVWPDGGTTMTSRIGGVVYRPEPFEVPTQEEPASEWLG